MRWVGISQPSLQDFGPKLVATFCNMASVQHEIDELSDSTIGVETPDRESKPRPSKPAEPKVKAKAKAKQNSKVKAAPKPAGV